MDKNRRAAAHSQFGAREIHNEIQFPSFAVVVGERVLEVMRTHDISLPAAPAARGRKYARQWFTKIAT